MSPSAVPLRIAHVTTIDLSLRYLLLNQLRCIQRAGYDVTGISATGREVRVIQAAGIQHIAVPMTRRFTPLADLRSLWCLYRVMRRERFVIVHTHTPKAGLLGQLAARAAGVPVVINTLHGFYFHDDMRALKRRFYVWMERIAARCSDVILSQNAEDIQTALQEGICSRDAIKYLGNGIDIARFNPTALSPERIQLTRNQLAIPRDARVVGFVGRLVAEKGILELLRAARVIRRYLPNVRLLIVGRIDRNKSDVVTPAVARDIGVSDICTFTGMRNDMPEIYSLMDVLVLPSQREGFPRAPMEASAMRVPCVVTDIRGCREAVEHGRNGLLVPLHDTDALAAATLKILLSPGLAKSMGDQGRQMAIERFDERGVFERVLTEYARILTRRGIQPPTRTGQDATNLH